MLWPIIGAKQSADYQLFISECIARLGDNYITSVTQSQCMCTSFRVTTLQTLSLTIP